MKGIGRAVAAILGTTLLCLASFGYGGREGGPDRIGLSGFDGLTWGMSVEAVRERYPDLTFDHFILNGEKEIPWKMYVRTREGLVVEGVAADSISCGFRDNSLEKVVVRVSYRVGPRTLVPESERIFDKFESAIESTAGKPVEKDVGAGLLHASRRAVWRSGSTTVLLSLSDRPESNAVDVILEIRDR